MKVKAVRKLKFDSAHRVVGHEGKCANIHGHEYTLEVYAEASELDNIGRVVDFSVIKQKLGSWIDAHFDHTMIVSKTDPYLPFLLKCENSKPFFVCNFNPTAENIATYLIREICPNLFKDTGVKVTKLRLHETSNCYVEVEHEA